jgi:glycosyltransferase involved in cell wall biosynthesis
MIHITVCICTFKRPQLLSRLLHELSRQDTDGQCTYSIVVVDNDQLRSAEAVVSEFAKDSPIRMKYCVESQQNIARARNKAVDNAEGDFVAFIDDDEFPVQGWLRTLLKTLNEYQVDGVLGPVKPHFDAAPPRWLVEGGFHDRPEDPTGKRLDWGACRTGNVLLRRELFAELKPPFRPECLSGEDQDFFRRVIEKGRSFVWCNEAVVYEVVPPARWKRSFLVRRALFRGVFSLRNHGFPARRILQSVVAVPAYGAALPVALVFGQAKFMNCVFKFSYHLGRLLAAVGVNPLGQHYVSE